MGNEEQYRNILIMAEDLEMDDFFIDCTSNFFVDSSFNRNQTTGMIMQVIRLVSALETMPKVRLQRILITITPKDTGTSIYKIQSPIDVQPLCHILKRVATLLDDPSSEIKFFCPND
ncbi:MAG: hypothetical protein HFJ58_04860 [Clostridia bacterium]|nr:hypothetical protein [Clostridia bacterium]